MRNFLLFANRQFIVRANRDGSGVQAFRLNNRSNAIAIDFDVRWARWQSRDFVCDTYTKLCTYVLCLCVMLVIYYVGNYGPSRLRVQLCCITLYWHGGHFNGWRPSTHIGFQLVGQLAWQAHLSQVQCLMPYSTLPRSKWTTPVLGLANPNFILCAATLMNKHISYM